MSVEVKRVELTDEQSNDVTGGLVGFDSIKGGAHNVYSSFNPSVKYKFDTKEDMQKINKIKSQYYSQYGYNKPEVDEMILAACLAENLCHY